MDFCEHTSIKVLHCNSTEKKKECPFYKTSENYRWVINNFYSDKMKVLTEEDNIKGMIYKEDKDI